MAQIERFSVTIPASGVVELPRGNVLLILSSTVAINVRIQARGTSEGVNGITGGVHIRRAQTWDEANLSGAAGGIVVYFFGYEAVDRDSIDLFLQTTAIAGIAVVSEDPSASHATVAPVSIVNAAAATVAANLTRKRIWVNAPDTNTGTIYVQTAAAGVRAGIPLGPAAGFPLATKAAFNIRNDSGVAQEYSTFEES